MRHLISVSDLSRCEIEQILCRAANDDMFVEKRLNNKKFVSMFFENSTRTLSSFEIAIINAGGSSVRFDVQTSSVSKGETLSDTVSNLNAMDPDSIIIRHSHAGVPNFMKKFVSCPIINGGDGAHSHPTQALLDLYTIADHFGHGDIVSGIACLDGKTVAIVGDIRNSRVFNSISELFGIFGLRIILVAPPHFVGGCDCPPGAILSHDLSDVIGEVDILVSLRTQTERHHIQLYGSLRDYALRFCIRKDLVGDRDVIIMHPGPVHRNVDIDDEMLLDSRCKVLDQVRNGVRVRMAVMEFMLS